jgi:hypothetical protein
MSSRSNEYDVSLEIKTTDPQAVNDEIDRIYRELYQGASTEQLDLAFRDMAQLYRGEYPGYHSCDTAYHDTQHVLDVTLAMARLINGYERGRIGVQPMDDSLFRLGVITALFHDCGYVRELSDDTHKNGAEMTLTHVSRGSHFLKDYLPKIGMGDVADIASELIHFTGYEVAVANINMPAPIHRLLGTMLGSADIIAQMADRCYLEKCLGSGSRDENPGFFPRCAQAAQRRPWRQPRFCAQALRRAEPVSRRSRKEYPFRRDDPQRGKFRAAQPHAAENSQRVAAATRRQYPCRAAGPSPA